MRCFTTLHVNLLLCRRFAPGLAAKPLLGAGCGTGGVVSASSTVLPNHNTIGLDADRFACERAQAKSERPVCTGSVNVLPFVDGPFGAIVSASVLRHHGVNEQAALDNMSSRRTEVIRNWFAKGPRRHVHCTPASASWINQVEHFFANLTEKQIRRGTHCSTAELEAAVTSYIETVNANPEPFAWTKSADDILATIKRFCLRTLKTAEIRTEIGKTSQSGH